MKNAKITKQWMRNASDDKAVANGCWFDELRAAYAVWWIERYCRLYEGSDGDPLILRGCGDCKCEVLIHDSWFLDDGETPNPAVVAHYRARAERHCKCVAAGHFIDWQFETFMRLFGWVKHSEKLGREVRRFREASIWIAKKNKKSPSLAALGLYLLAGDGEHGQKVFLAAKDGTQAREIAGKHAIEMLQQSEELTEACTVNKNLSQITHEESRSLLKPLSSSNSRTKESKEGLNGSVLIDETHVVDRDFVSRISRAGISRNEPLMCEFSTAGNNPDGYGKERFDYSCKVISGDVVDQELLAVVHAAPQDLSDEDLEADPLKYGRMANPAMGHTVDPQEFLSDYNKSKVSAEKLAEFKMYRLNIWQHSACPWLNQDDWRRGAMPDEVNEAELAGRDCFGALDIARVYDTSAFVLVFPPVDDDEPWKMLAYFWLPEETAKERASLVPYATWAAADAITLTPGNWGEDEPIRERMNEANRQFKLHKVAYDKRFADSLIQRLNVEDGWPIEQFHEYPQYPAAYTAATEELERLLLSGKFAHADNPVLNWQAEHVVLLKDNKKNKKPMKPKKSDYRSVDGIQAGVMALDEAMHNPIEEPSIYSTPGNLAL